MISLPYHMITILFTIFSKPAIPTSTSFFKFKVLYNRYIIIEPLIRILMRMYCVCVYSEQSRFWSNIIPKTVEMALSSNLLMNVYFEKYLEEPIADFRSRLGIQLAVEDTDVESIPMNTNPEHNTKQSELT